MNQNSPIANQLNQLRLQLFIFSFLVAIGHISASYSLLTVNNSFNFNNNFHLIGFISFLSFMVQLLLILLYSRLVHQKAEHHLSASIVRTDPFAGMSTFIMLLVMLFFTMLSPLIYFLLINEFMLGEIRSILFGLLGLSLTIMCFSYWVNLVSYFERKSIINWWSIINKAIIFIVFGLIFAMLLNFLTGIIPAELRPPTNPYLTT